MPARVLVGVVADDRGVRDRPVDAAVDAREARGHLVDRAVEVVDPPLERDGEVDEVSPAAAEEHPLRLARRACTLIHAHQASPMPIAPTATPAIATIRRLVAVDVHAPTLAAARR